MAGFDSLPGNTFKIIKMAGIKNKSHGLFWTLIRSVKGYNEAYKEVIKEGLIHEYTAGKTTSLSQMYNKYPADYARMIEDLKGSPSARKERYRDEQDKDRKRAIAAACGWIDRVGYKFKTRDEKIKYAIACICRAANCLDFNKIPSSKLTAISFLFNNKKDVDVDLPELKSIISKN